MPEKFFPPASKPPIDEDWLRQWLKSQTIAASQVIGTDNQLRIEFQSEADGGDAIMYDVDGNAIAQYDQATSIWFFNAGGFDFRDLDGSPTRLLIQRAADGGDFRFVDTSGNIVGQYDEGSDTWFFNSQGFNIREAGGATNRFNIVSNDDIILYDAAGSQVGAWNQGNDRWEFSKDIYATDGSTGLVEVFPKGTLIDMGTAGSATDISNVSASETEQAITKQTIACDYASQPLYVKVTVEVTWKGLPAGVTVGIRPGVGGTARGQQPIYEPPVTDADATAASSSSTGNQSASHQHGLGVGSYRTNIVSSHRHLLVDDPGEITNSNNASHSHDMSHTHSHSHDAVPDFFPMSITWAGQVTADGGGDITFSLFTAGGGGSADIHKWQITYEVWRR